MTSGSWELDDRKKNMRVPGGQHRQSSFILFEQLAEPGKMNDPHGLRPEADRRPEAWRDTLWTSKTAVRH